MLWKCLFFCLLTMQKVLMAVSDIQVCRHMSQTEKMSAVLGFYQYHIFSVYNEVQCGLVVNL